MKVLLVFPPAGRRAVVAKIGMEPLSLEYVAGQIKAHHDVQVLDLRVEKRLELALQHYQPHVVGISGFTHQFNNILDVARRVKQWNREIFVAVGGIHVNSNSLDFDNPCIDAIVTGVNTSTFSTVMQRVEARQSLDGIPGVHHRVDGKLRISLEKNPTASLDELPVPDRSTTARWRHLYSNRGQSRQALMRTSAGCHFRCYFCNCWVATRGKYLVGGVDGVIDELATIQEDEIWLCDDEAFLDTERMWALAKAIKESGIKKQYFSFVRAQTVRQHRDLIEAWRDVGLRGANIGLDAFTDEELKEMNKDCVVEDSLEGLAILDDLGIAVDGYVITDPSYGRQEFKRTREVALDWVTRFPCLDIFFTIKTPFPGTVLYKQVRKQIVQNNYDLFDVFHAVVPTRLPAEEFYLRFARLWEEVLSHSRMGRSKRFNARELHSFCNVIANGWVAHEPVPEPVPPAAAAVEPPALAAN